MGFPGWDSLRNTESISSVLCCESGASLGTGEFVILWSTNCSLEMTQFLPFHIKDEWEDN